MPYSITIDSKDIDKLTDTLKKLHRSAFPVAARETLNNLAFDVKKQSILSTAKDKFTLRQPAFFRKYSGVEKATGFNDLVAKVGMTDDEASTNFHEQEVGGAVKHVAIPTHEARLSGSPKRKVAEQYWLGKGKIVDRSKRGIPGRKFSRKSKLVSDMMFAHRHGLWVRHKGIMLEVNGFTKNGDSVKFKTRPLYSVQRGRRVNIKGVRFMRTAAEKSLKNTESFFKLAADKQFNKYFR